MSRYERNKQTINSLAVSVLVAQSPGQRERYLDALTMAVIDADGSYGFELDRKVKLALERANPNMYRRI